jgi:hypothetical protein
MIPRYPLNRRLDDAEKRDVLPYLGIEGVF